MSHRKVAHIAIKSVNCQARLLSGFSVCFANSVFLLLTRKKWPREGIVLARYNDTALLASNRSSSHFDRVAFSARNCIDENGEK